MWTKVANVNAAQTNRQRKNGINHHTMTSKYAKKNVLAENEIFEPTKTINTLAFVKYDFHNNFLIFKKKTKNLLICEKRTTNTVEIDLK